METILQHVGITELYYGLIHLISSIINPFIKTFSANTGSVQSIAESISNHHSVLMPMAVVLIFSSMLLIFDSRKVKVK